MNGIKIYHLSHSLTWVIFVSPGSLPSTKEIKYLSFYFESESKHQNRQLYFKTHSTVTIPVNVYIIYLFYMVFIPIDTINTNTTEQINEYLNIL